MLTHVEFRSDRFPADPDEDELVNPGLWGRRLARFLCDGLRSKGFQATDPWAEDWGWQLRIEGQPISMWIGCGHYQEYDDGYLCFIEPHKPYVRKWFRKIDTREHVDALRRAIDELLSSEAGIHSKRWWTHEDFNLQY
jgi:hypothetical protein